MKTVSFGISNYCVPCHNYCRYCLLSSCGKASGIDFDRGLKFAERVINELTELKPNMTCNHYIGYCMDSPRLFDYIDFCKKYSLPNARFLQMNGFAFRTENEIDDLMKKLQDAGVEMLDISFYGTGEYHDRFAGRKGDFAFLMNMTRSAIKNELQVWGSIPLIRENLAQMVELRRILDDLGIEKYSYFLPHSKGRGRSLEDQRITKSEFEILPKYIRDSFQKIRHMTEKEWLTSGEITEPEKRTVMLVLKPDNIEHFEGMKAAEIVYELEAMDDTFRAQIPSASELAKRYGRSEGQELYRFKDLLLRWRQEYINEFGLDIYDMQDETHHFSIHI